MKKEVLGIDIGQAMSNDFNQGWSALVAKLRESFTVVFFSSLDHEETQMIKWAQDNKIMPDLTSVQASGYDITITLVY